MADQYIGGLPSARGANLTGSIGTTDGKNEAIHGLYDFLLATFGVTTCGSGLLELGVAGVLVVSKKRLSSGKSGGVFR